MPDLHGFHDLLDESVGGAPRFELAALARRRRRHRRRQVGALAGVVAVLAAAGGALALGRGGSPHHSAVIGAHDETTTVQTTGAIAATTTAGDTSTTAARPSTSPGPDDFDGRLAAAATRVTVGQPVMVAWTIHNRTDRGIVPDADPTAGPDVVALVCAPLAGDGAPRVPLGPDDVFIPKRSAVLAGGSTLGESDTYAPTTDDVGTVTCAVVILDRSDGPANLAIVARVHAIAPVTITVSP